MELLYIWVEKYEDKFVHQGFNISTKYNITYKEGSLSIKKNVNTFSAFPNMITSCKAVIGENGAGKTTLINLICKIFGNSDEFIKKILVFKSDKEIKIYSNFKGNKIKIDENSEKGKCIKNNEYENLIQSLIVIKYSSAFHTEYNEVWGCDSKKCFDISTDYCLRDIYVRNNENVDRPLYTLLNFKDLLKIKNFTFEDEIKLESTRFKKPEKLKFDIKTNVREYISKIPDFRKRYYDLLRKLQKNDKRNKIAILSFATAVIYKDYEKGKTEKYNKYFEDIIETLYNRNNDKREKINTEEMTEITQKLGLINNNGLSEMEIQTFLQVLNDLKFNINSKHFTKEKVFDDYFMTAYLDKQEDSIINNILKLQKNTIMQEITQVTWCNNFGFSTGQEYVLLMYSRFYDLFKNKLKEGNFKNLLILLDEADVYFHPNWKRHFLNDFIIFIKAIMKKFKFKFNIQLIIATNEPYIISDLPRENIIFLKNENGRCKVCDNDNFKQTFGANIHTLLTNTFFMDNTIGEFANQKIKKSLRVMDKYKKFIDEKISKEEFKIEYINYMGCEEDEEIDIQEMKKKIKYIIEIIGEPLIERKLEEIYRTTFPEDRKDYELEIKKLQQEKAKLQEIIKYKGLDNIEGIMKLLDAKIRELKEKAGYGVW